MIVNYNIYSVEPTFSLDYFVLGFSHEVR